MAKIFKNPTRYNRYKRPMTGDNVVFSPVIELIDGLYIPLKQKMKCTLKNNAICKVLKNTEHTVVVSFDSQRYMVSPMFLIKQNLSQTGKKLLSLLESRK